MISDKNVEISGNMRPIGFSGVIKIGKALLSGECSYVYIDNMLQGVRVKKGAIIAFPNSGSNQKSHPKPIAQHH
jgi:hypothetical protein